MLPAPGKKRQGKDAAGRRTDRMPPRLFPGRGGVSAGSRKERFQGLILANAGQGQGEPEAQLGIIAGLEGCLQEGRIQPGVQAVEPWGNFAPVGWPVRVQRGKGFQDCAFIASLDEQFARVWRFGRAAAL